MQIPPNLPLTKGRDQVVSFGKGRGQMFSFYKGE